MNGWQRIGVVISVIWNSAIFGYAAYERIEMPIPIFTEVTQQPVGGEWNEPCQKLFLECYPHRPSNFDTPVYLEAYKTATS
jgi:hypothetical protein